MRIDIEEKLGRTFAIFDAMNYRIQAVSGTNCLTEVGVINLFTLKFRKLK